MVNRISTVDWLSDDDALRLASAVGQGLRLHSITTDVEEVRAVKRELEAQGHRVSVSSADGVYRVRYGDEVRLPATRKVMACFTPVGVNAFSPASPEALRRLAGVYDYEFDDGSIWRLEQYDDGEYLVKEVEDNDEDKVIRVASAENEGERYVDGANYLSAAALTVGELPKGLVALAEHNSALKRELLSALNGEVKKQVDAALRELRRSSSKGLVDVVRRAMPRDAVSLRRLVGSAC